MQWRPLIFTHRQRDNINIHVFDSVMIFCCVFFSLTYVKYSDFGVVCMLNSATGTPLDAILGPNMAAGYTMEDVPTYR